MANNISNSPEHSEWSYEQIQELLLSVKGYGRISKYFTYLMDNIRTKTEFLDELYSGTKIEVNNAMRIKTFIQNIRCVEDIPLCKFCNTNRVTMLERHAYAPNTCCHDPICIAKNKQEATRKKWEEKYPEGHPARNAEVNEKKKKTNLEKYGTDETLKSKVVRDKIKQTSLSRYGTEAPIASKEVQEKIMEKVLTRYDGKHFTQTEEYKEKMQKHYSEKYGEGVISPFGSPEVLEKIRQRNISALGVANPFSSPTIQKKIRETLMERYGVDNPMKSHLIKKRVEATCLRVYGKPNPMQSAVIKNRIVERNIRNFGVEHFYQTDEFKKKSMKTMTERYGRHFQSSHLPQDTLDKLNDPIFMQIEYEKMGAPKLAKILEVNSDTIYEYLKKHSIPINPNVGTSFAERSIAEFVESLGVTIVRNDRTILDGKELDIFIPSHNLAIEYNGVFWHSTKFKSPRTHIDKTIKCESKGVRLIQIFEDEWNDRPDVIKRKIAMLLNKSDLPTVYARQCEVREIDNKMAKDFYITYHIQGHANGSTVLGLYHNDVLVACMSFKINFGYMELIRFASSCRVTGGFSKLLKHFMKFNPDVDHIISFADRRWSDGNVYEKNGFQNIETIYPNYYYVVDDRRIKKQKFRHKYLAEMLDNYDPELSEKENTEAHDIWRIYDCGMFKYRIDNPFRTV